MSRPMISEHNTETDTYITREMNDDEFAAYELDAVIYQEHQIAEAQKAAEKAALLAKLGITEDEAKLLLG